LQARGCYSSAMGPHPLDYIFFFYGLSFLLLASVCVLLSRRPEARMAWPLLFLFGLLHGLNEWLDLLALTLGDSERFWTVRLVVMAASFLALAEFGRRSLRLEGLRVPGPASLVALPVLATAGLWVGDWNVAIRHSFGFVGALLAAAALLRSASRQQCLSLRGAALGMFLYGIASGLIVPRAGGGLGTWFAQEDVLGRFGLPIQLFRGLLALWLTGAIWLHARQSIRELQEPRLRRLQLLSSIGVSGAILGFLALGWIGTEALGRRAGNEAKRDGESAMALRQEALSNRITEADGLARTLSGSPWILPLLLTPGPELLDRAHSVLDRYSRMRPDLICYLLDSRGVTLASSNRGTAASFVGKSCAIRPYFRDALAGRASRYFALGLTSGERGYYASAPVFDEAGAVRGVVAIKITLDRLEIDWRGRAGIALADPQGVIFLSNRKDWILQTLRPLTPEAKASLAGTRQFGQGPFRALFPKEPKDGDEIRLADEWQSVLRRPAPMEGWSLLLFRPLREVGIARLIGIGATLFLCLVALAIFVVAEISFVSAGELARSEQRYRSLVEDQTELLCRFFPDGRICFANGSFSRASQKPLEALLASRFADSILPTDRPALERLLAALAPAAPVVSGELRSSVPGPTRWEQWTLRGIYDDGAHLLEIQAVGRDVTEKKSAEDQIIRAERLAAVGTLTAGVAHQFNNINAAILGFAQLAQMKSDLAPDTRHCLQRISDAALRAKQVTTSLLAFASHGRARVAPANLTRIAQETIHLVQREFEAQGICLDLHLRPVPDTLMNEAQIGQVILNLLVNASHALAGRPVQVIHVETREDASHLLLRVRDTGCGIPPEHRLRVFTPFFTTKGEHAASGSSQEKVKGTGLGLSVAMTIMLRHDGELFFESEPDQGTVFTLRLPLRKDETPPSFTAVSPSLAATAPVRPARILVIDDDPDVRELLERFLVLEGHSVLGCADGWEGLSRLGAETFDLIILDMQMPEMQGEEFLRQMPAAIPCPVLVLTGNMGGLVADEELRRLAGRRAFEICRKPLELEALRKVLAALLAPGAGPGRI